MIPKVTKIETGFVAEISAPLTDAEKSLLEYAMNSYSFVLEAREGVVSYTFSEWADKVEACFSMENKVNLKVRDLLRSISARDDDYFKVKFDMKKHSAMIVYSIRGVGPAKDSTRLFELGNVALLLESGGVEYVMWPDKPAKVRLKSKDGKQQITFCVFKPVTPREIAELISNKVNLDLRYGEKIVEFEQAIERSSEEEPPFDPFLDCDSIDDWQEAMEQDVFFR